MVEDVKTEQSEIDVQKLMEQYDSESRIRRPLGIMAIIISIIAISMSAFHFYTGGFGLLLGLKQRSIHLAFTLCLIFLIYPGFKKGFDKNKNKIPLYDIIIAILGVVVSLYLVVFYNDLAVRAGLPTILDLIMGGMTIILVLEATRRVVGSALPIVVIVFILYS